MKKLHYKQLISRRRLNAAAVIAAALVVTIVGYRLLRPSLAATTATNFELESGQLSSPAKIVSDSAASAGNAVQFGSAPSYSRKLILPGIADPGVYKENDNLYFVSGTAPGNYLPIYKSTDLSTFTELTRYDPNALDPNYTYCYLWAPSFIKRGPQYFLHFSAERVGKGQPCPASTVEPTTFYATTPDLNMNFGLPQMINPNTALPRTYTPYGCPTDGCNKVIRIDSNMYYDGSRYWMHYVWFSPQFGNTISAYPLDAPTSLFQVAQATTAAEERINEGPTLFDRNGKIYLMYSQGGYRSDYIMRYMMGTSVTALTKANSTVYTHSVPLYANDGHLIQNFGHNSITSRNGQYYNIYHAANFNSAGTYLGRDTYIQPIMFKADGTIDSLDTVTLHWPGTSGSTYALDVQLKDGSWVTDCIDSNTIDTATSYTYESVCKSAADKVVLKSDVSTFRINTLENGTVVNSALNDYDGYTDDITLK